MSGGKVNITAAVPANKPVSNWWQHSGPIHTHSSELSDKISRICLSSVCFQATKQTCAQRLWQRGPSSPRTFLSHFYKGQFSVITVVWWQLWYLIVCLFFSVIYFFFPPHACWMQKEICCTVWYQRMVTAYVDTPLHVCFLLTYLHWPTVYNYMYLYCSLSVLEELVCCFFVLFFYKNNLKRSSQ